MMVGEVLADRYELEQLVGAGGMSTVFRAHDRVLERTVALKLLHERLLGEDEVVERFRREARMVAGLSHHSIVNVIDRGDHHGRPFIVFEFIDGESLKQLVARAGPLPVERALELAIQVAGGLAFAHQKGFVHRDVKPQNVLLNGNGQAKVTDFGIARSLEVQHGATQTGTVLGTCDYLAPEQAQGRQVGEHSDIYSLGIVVYELLTGSPPFTGDNFVAVAMQHINDPAPPVSLSRPEVSARLDAAVAKALAKDPRDRFETMSAFRQELEACLDEVRLGGDAAPTGVMPSVRKPRPERAPGPPRRSPARFLIAAAAVIAAAVVVWALTRGGGAPGSGGGGSPVALHGVASYDPDGDQHEHSELVKFATDGSVATYWQTERYRYADGSLHKPGVGLVLDAGSALTLHHLTIITTTPGFTAEIQAGDGTGGPFRADSASQTVAAHANFSLRNAKARYYLIWITNRGSAPSVKVNEVTAD